MSNGLLFLVSLLSMLLRNLKDRSDCPDGVCDDALAMAGELSGTLRSPNVGVFGLISIWKMFRCVPMDRVKDVFARLGKLIAACDSCPEEGCSFLDLIGCLDVPELVSIVTEVLAIIRDSSFCYDGDGGEITLGQAAA